MTRRNCRAGIRTSAPWIVGLLLATAGLTACANPPLGGAPGVTAGQPAQVAVSDKLRDAVPEKYRQAGLVQVATNAPFPPYEMFAGENSQELVGLEIDLGKAIGAKLGLDFRFTQQPFDGLITGLQAGKYDVLMATLFDTVERQQAIDFVDYAQSGSAIMVKNSTTDIKVLDDLCGKKVAVQSGSPQVQLVEMQGATCTAAGRPAVEVKPFPQFNDELLALSTGTADAVVHDFPALVYAANENPVQGLLVLTDPAAPGGYEAANIGIGVRKDEPALRDAIHGAVSELMADGTYRQIFERYSLERSMIDAPTINAATG